MATDETNDTATIDSTATMSIDEVRELTTEIIRECNRIIVGKKDILSNVLVAMLANGHVILEGVPGLAKTYMARTYASILGCAFKRIQLTVDTLPSDLLGSNVFNQRTGEFWFRKGPVFSNLVLADEINRCPPKSQSALLEVMEERQVSLEGVTRKLPKPFLIIATQNPVEQEGTYPLPEAQKDRFLMHVNIGYPDKASEIEVIRLVRGEKSGKIEESEGVEISQDLIFAARDEIAKVKSSEVVEQYIVDLVFATRYPEKYDETLDSYIDIGVSPRASLGLDICSRVYAWLQGRDHTTPEDVRAVVHDIFRHRITASYEAQSERVSNDDIIDTILGLVALPA